MSRYEILSSTSSDDSSVDTIELDLSDTSDFQCEPINFPILATNHMLTSSKTAMVKPSVLPTSMTSWPHQPSPSLIGYNASYDATQLLMTTAALPSFNPVLTTAKSMTALLYSRTSAAFLIIRPPFEMQCTSKQIPHPFSPPASLPRPKRLPLLVTATSSTAPLTPYAIYRSPRINLSPAAISNIDETTPSTSASVIHRSSSIFLRPKVPPNLIVTPWTIQGNCPTTANYSRAKNPIFKTVTSSRVRLPHLPERIEVPLLPVASSSNTRNPHSQIVLLPETGNLVRVDPPSRSEHYIWTCRPPPPYEASVRLPLDPLSSTEVATSPFKVGLPLWPHRSPSYRASVEISSATLSPPRTSTTSALKAGLPLWPYRHPPSYDTIAHLPSASASSRSSVLTSASPSSLYEVLESTTPFSTVGFRELPYSPNLDSRQTASLSSTISPRMNRDTLLRNSPAYWLDVLQSTSPSSRANVFASAATVCRGDVLARVASSSKGDTPVSTPPFRCNVPSSTTASFGSDVPASVAPSSRFDIPASAAPSSRFDIPASAAPSSKNDVLASAAPLSRSDVLASVVPSSSANVLALNIPSSKASFSKSSAPPPGTASISMTGDSHLSAAAYYKNGAPLKPKTSFSGTGNFPLPTYSSTRKMVSLSPNASRSNTGVPLSSNLTTSNIRASSPATQNKSLSYPSSSTGPWYI